MSDAAYNLAIETSQRRGEVALGRGDELLKVVELQQPRRHNVELMPAIASLCDSYNVPPNDLNEIYISLGPGSFTGLRVSVATAKMLAMATGARLVGVPTLDVIGSAAARSGERWVLLNGKRDTWWAGRYRDGERQGEPGLVHEDELGDLPRLTAETHPPTAEATWHLGRAAARAGRFDDPATLVPIYARRPEAVELWEARG